MLTTVSFGTKRSINSFDIQSHSIPQTENLLPTYDYSNKKSTKYNYLDQSSKTYSSVSILLSLLREIQTKRRLKENNLKQGFTENDSIFEFLNQKSRLYEWKFKVYNFFNKPNNFWSIFYHILVFCLVFTCLIFTVFSTISRFSEKASKVLTILEKVIIIWFCNEFCLRLWSSSCKQRYYGLKGKLRYMRVPSHLLDLMVIILSVVVLIADTRNGSEIFAVSAFRGFHRLFQVFQVLTLHRQIQPWKLLIHVIKDQLHQLLIIFYIEFISIFILAYISYILEKDAQNNQFSSLADAMWWAVITLSTVGYGDRVHVTWWGKLVSGLFTILGVALFALPAGIIGAGLAIRIEKEENNRLKKNKRLAAIVLIQTMWRCYTITNNSDFDPNLFFLNHSNDKIVVKFLSLTKFFVAKSKFKSTRNVLDLENDLNGYKLSQIAVNSRIKRIEDFVNTIDKSVTNNEIQISNQQNILSNRIESIGSLIDYIESEINRQNILIDLIAFSSVSNGNLLKNVLNEYRLNQIY